MGENSAIVYISLCSVAWLHQRLKINIFYIVLLH
jgi:hypothetical protein